MKVERIEHSQPISFPKINDADSGKNQNGFRGLLFKLKETDNLNLSESLCYNCKTKSEGKGNLLDYVA